MPPQTPVWSPDPHTLAKHELLRRYLGAWFPILTQQGFNSRVVFIDGFAGPGVYTTGEPGSPIVALSTLVEHAAFSSMKGEFVFLFIENDAKRVASLNAEIAAYWKKVGGKPANVTVGVTEGDFEEVAAGLLDDLDKHGARLAPAVALVDPFGFSGVSLDTICRLTAFPKCEVIFSFMYNSLNRWVTHPDPAIQNHLLDLFGTDEFRQATGMKPKDRNRFLHQLYKRQLADVGKFKYVLDFEMIDARNRSVYSLIFGTRHPKGLEAMKTAMWAIDPSGQFRFSDQHAGLTSLFGTVDTGPLRAAILAEFAGREVPVELVREFVLAETIFGPSHYKKQVLKLLEKEALIVPVRGQKTPGTYPDGTVIRFV